MKPQTGAAAHFPEVIPETSTTEPRFTDIANLDNDGDGLSALLEHFLGTSDSNSSEGASSYQLNTINLPDGSIYPTFSITYPIGADDITPDAFWSSDLQSWSNSPSERILVR